MTDRMTEFTPKDVDWKNTNTLQKENLGLKDALKNLDNSSIFYHTIQKVEIIGVFCGIKPICILEGFSDSEETKQVVTIVEQLGLKTNVEYWNNAGYQYDVQVARNKETLQKYKESEKMFESGDDEKGQLETGKLYGYPESSGPAYLNEELRLDKRKKQLIGYKDLAAYSTFCHFVLSKDNYKEEINQYGRKLMLATKEYLPSTFKKIVKEWRTEKIWNTFQSIKNSFSKK